MQPGMITPHPDAPDAYIVMRAPPGMENCVDLAYRFVHCDDGAVGMVAEFIPDAEDIAKMQAGQPVRFLYRPCFNQNGQPIVPPIALWVRDEGEI